MTQQVDRPGARGVRVLVVSAMYPTETDPVRGVVVRREVERLRAAGVDVRVVGKAPGWRGYLAQARLARAAAREADVVHAHYGTSGLIVALAARRAPLVVTMHGSDIAHGPRPSTSKYWPQYLMSIAGAARARAIVVQDASMTATLPLRLRARTCVLGQPVAVPTTDDPVPARAGVLFLSARSRPVKRFALAQEAARLAGVELDSLDRHPVDEVADAMRRARVGLLTSEREGLPVAVKEALAAGLRVVSVRLPSLEPLAEEVGDVLLLTDHDPQAVAAGLTRALGLPELDAAARARLHEVLAAHGWSEAEHTRRLVGLYRSARDRGRSGADGAVDVGGTA